MEQTFNRVSRYIYFFIVGIVVGISVLLIAECDKPSQMEKAYNGAVDFSSQWFTADGTAIERADKLNLLKNSSSTAENSIYATIPEDIPENVSLCFRAKHIYFSVYIDGKEVYVQNLPENKLYTDSVGAVWVFIPLYQEQRGKTVEIRYRLSYPKSTCGVDYLTLSSERGMFIKLINEKMFGFIMSLIYITFAFILIVVDIPISIKLNKSHTFMYLGFITLSVAMYSIVETQVFQLFIGNERIMHLLSCFSLLLIPMPMILYTNSMFPFRNKYTILFFSLLHFVMFVLLGILNVTKIADYHDTMTAIHLFLIIAVCTMFIKIVGYIISRFRNKTAKDIYIVFEITGLAITLVSGTIDIMRFYFTNAKDPAKFVRIGLLGFVICFAISSCERLITALTLSAKAQLISNLAYHDGLTG